MNTLIPKIYAHGHTRIDVSNISPFFQHNAPGTTVLGTLMVAVLLTAVVLAIFLYFRQRQKRRAGKIGVTVIQNVAWLYTAMFFATTSLTYLPGLTDDVGNFAGLFKLDLIDDLLHFGSGVWVMLAAWHSTRQSILYFRVFGAIYALDGVIGLATQRGILDFGVWLYEFPNLSLIEIIGANTPHILIGGIALFVGFILSRKFKDV